MGSKDTTPNPASTASYWDVQTGPEFTNQRLQHEVKYGLQSVREFRRVLDYDVSGKHIGYRGNDGLAYLEGGTRLLRLSKRLVG